MYFIRYSVSIRGIQQSVRISIKMKNMVVVSDDLPVGTKLQMLTPKGQQGQYKLT